MEIWVGIVIVVVVVAAVGAAAWIASRRRRSQDLRRTFGPEYDRAASRTDDRGAAERDLEARRERRAALDIRPLPADARQRYAEAWRLVQQRFVDQPVEAVRDADDLLERVMADRGYPTEDFEQQAADISVDHPDLVENYRRAHAVSRSTDGGDPSTEDLRKAMVHYRSLFNDLLGSGDPA